MEAHQLNLLFIEDWVSLPWTEEEVVMLHEWLLIRSLELLNQASHPETIADVMMWVNRNDDSPFGFNSCCSVSFYDHEELREGLNRIYRKPSSLVTGQVKEPAKSMTGIKLVI